LNKKETINFLKKENFFPSKKMGQNFLLCNQTKKRIVEVSRIKENDYVLEIGPGLGAITSELIKKTKNLFLVELDKRLYAFLKEKYHDVENLKIINDDILSIDLNDLFKEIDSDDIKIVANLPYSISSKIILILLNINKVKQITIMVQKEMADRLAAPVGTKEYNGFTALLSLVSNVKQEFLVDKSLFYPEPNIQSVVITISVNEHFDNFNEIGKFFRLCFSSKRKSLVNNLNSNYKKEKILEILDELNIDRMIRAERLSPQQLLNLLEKLKNHSVV
jgi:16S rRNA (adenine1518-N6/adenine1519-N6)-dimethyltransferase